MPEKASLPPEEDLSPLSFYFLVNKNQKISTLDYSVKSNLFLSYELNRYFLHSELALSGIFNPVYLLGPWGTNVTI
ncbi:MAG: hypothetical protein QTN59_03325 [Candidatus Electrothrix communis]|nr:hypothetical protein [Desulfobulbus sp. US4]WLE97869.1 MAG: hypothetical protein QTN59_03325 [Candidatus Electrothrix communis]